MVGKVGRSGIIAAAEQLFRDYGYKPVSLADIAGAAGIRKPSVYHHFPEGKEQLYVEVHLAVFDRIRRRVREALDGAWGSGGASRARALPGRLTAIVRAILGEKPLYLLSMMHHDMPKMTEQHRRQLGEASYNAVIAPIVEVVDQAITAGEARPLNAHAVAGSIVAMIEGNAVAYAAGYGDGDLIAMADQSLDLVLNGLVRTE